MNYDEFLSEEEEAELLEQKKKKQQQLIILLLLGFGAYYFLVYLPEEEKKKQTNLSNTDENSSAEEIQEALENDAWQKGRIWEFPVHSWADKIVKSKRSNLLGEYQKFSNLFPDGDRNEKFYFSRSAPYTVFFPSSLREYYEKGIRLRLENCEILEGEKELILSNEIKNWIARAERDPTRGNYEDGLGNNALFYGAPGTGKTETMRNLCVKANKYPLVVVAGSDLTPTESDQSAGILPLHKFAYTISELEHSLERDYGFEREENGEMRYMLFVDEANQVSNNSGFFQSNGLKFLKDCLESVDKDRDSRNLWAFATNHKDQVEKATFRKGRLSNALDFTWNWKVFKDFCEINGVDLPKRWKDDDSLTPKDEKLLAEFNVDIFYRYFLGQDDDVPERTNFWQLFIEENPNAEYIPEGKEKEVEIEIGEFLGFFWYIKEKYSTSFEGKYKDSQEQTLEKIVDTHLSNLVKVVDEGLDDILIEIKKTRDEGNETIVNAVAKLTEKLANR